LAEPDRAAVLQRLLADNAEQLAALERQHAEVVAASLDSNADDEHDPEGATIAFERQQLAALRAQSPGLPVVVASGQGQRENMLRAVGLGAYDFCEKPVDLAVLRTILDRALRLRELEDENQRLAAAPRPSPIPDIVTADEGMLKVCRTIERLGTVSVPVLLLGESGTGKEALARALHDLGPRAAKPFIALNCAAIPEALLESELFGHERGAFTGAVSQVKGKVEAAHGGTLFLDEVGDLPPTLQAKMLRFLQDQVIERIGGRVPIRVDVRVVSATNQPLEEQATTGQFRADLLYRLNSMTVRIPPLRERGGDSLVLARWFLAKYAREFGRRIRGFEAGALAAIGSHPWPGNVRELENAMHRAVLLSSGAEVDPEAIRLPDGEPLAAPAGSHNAARAVQAADAVSRAFVGRTVADVEQQLILDTLTHCFGNRTHAANILGISIRTLRNKLKEYGDLGISVPAPQSGLGAHAA